MSDALNDTQRRAVEELCERLYDAPDVDVDRVLQSDCDDLAVRDRVRRLLAIARDREGTAPRSDAPVLELLDLDRATHDAADDGTDLVGEQVDRYQIEAVIGRGGFGIVYLARQELPVERTVAVKVIRPGYGSREIRARFEAERQTLAMMSHPGIARIIDAGSLPDGRSYFVMEHVPGQPLTRYCDNHALTIQGRLDLFLRVCDAVGHAHAKGVIHRDLKPSNVLVLEEEARPVVIDFGISKVIGHQHSGETVATHQGVMIGTPEYTSPEQAGLDSSSADTRSDVYSLGVMLYELLTGQLPFDRERLRSSDLATVQRILRDETPPKPSVRAARASSYIERTAEADATPVPRKQLIGDLDWIVMRCLEKDPDRRYTTVDALAADIRRFLENEPVEAGPPSLGYRASKFVRRHRASVAAGSLVALSLVLGASISIVFALGQARERAIAEDRQRDLRRVTGFQSSVIEGLSASRFGATLRQDLVDGLSRSLERQGLSDTEAEDALSAFRESLDLINAADVSRSTLASTFLAGASERADAEFSDAPELLGAIHASLAESFISLGLPQRAIDHLERSLELRRSVLTEDHRDVLITLARLEGQRHSAGVEGTAQRLRAALDRAVQSGDIAAPATRRLALEYGRSVILVDPSEAERWLLYAARDNTEVGDDADELQIEAMQELVTLHTEIDRLDEAERIADQIVQFSSDAFGLDDTRTLAAMNRLANVLWRLQDFNRTIAVLQTAYERSSARYGALHPDTMTYGYGLARALHSAGQTSAATQLGRQIYQSRREALGAAHPDTAASSTQIAFWLPRNQRIEAFRNIATSYRLLHGPDHPYVLGSMLNLGVAMKFSDPENAARILRDVLDRRLRIYGEGHLEVLNARYNFGSTLRFARRFQEAEEQLRLAHDGYAERLGPDAYPVLVVRDEQAWLASDLDPKQGSEAFGELAADALRLLGPCHGMTMQALRQRLRSFLDMNRVGDAMDLLKEFIDATQRDMIESEQSRCLREYVTLCQRVGEADLSDEQAIALDELRSRLTQDPVE